MLMTDEEFRAEAKARGYKLIKISETENVKLLPCTCGKKSTCEIFTEGAVLRRCNGCGREAPAHKTSRGAKQNWNKMVEGRVVEDA